jgi:L-threonylcarbamoyladenylate synthase
VTLEQLEAVIGEVRQDVALKNQEAAPKAPGMKYTHYAPKAPLFLVKGNQAFLQKLVDEKRSDGLKVGIITAYEHQQDYKADYVVVPGSLADLHTVATGLYDALRQFDELEVDVIFSEMFPDHGIGAAVMNRLEKAAGHQIIKEHV